MYPNLFLFWLSWLLVEIGVPDADQSRVNGKWIHRPPGEWPQITMINQIEYVDKIHPVAGCAFLLATENDTLAATAKHILTYFRSTTMDAVAFKNTLKTWKMYPKNNPADSVVVAQLLNENLTESIDGAIPPKVDWLLFSIKKKSRQIQPLKFRTKPFQPGEKVYIVGWRYSDVDCPQVVYEGNYVKSLDGSVIISTKLLSDNKMPGLSGAPVIDANGCVIGLMSRKYGKLEQVAAIGYPMEIIEKTKTQAPQRTP